MVNIEPAGASPPAANLRARLAQRWFAIEAFFHANPGSMRSLIWAFMGLAALDQGETALTHVSGVLSVVFGIVSALMRPALPAPSAETIAAAVARALETRS